MRTLYYIWESMVDFKDETFRINLLLNRASPWADVYSHIPYQGPIEIKVKKPLKTVRVRAPEWINAHSAEIVTQNNGQQRQIRWEGRYLNLGSVKPRDLVSVTFPIPQSSTKETIGNTPYTLSIRSNTVISIDTPGINGPLYQRSYYLAQQAPSRKVERFIPEEFIAW